MSDFKLDDDGDLDTSSGGFEIVEGADATEQELEIRMKQVQGNWFLDLNQGIPLFSRVLVNGPNEADIYSIYSAEMLAADNVLKVQKLQLFDDVDNALRIKAKVLSTEGVVNLNAVAVI